MSFISNLTELKNRINTLRGDNAVTPFAYDSEAYETDDADGHADFDSRRHNNIPLKDNLVLGLNPFVTNKGLRDQASSFTRQLINHFCGRTSYNLNKSVDVVHGLLDKTLAYANQPEGFPMLDTDGRIDSSQLPESAVEYKGTWNAETNTPHLSNGTGTKGDMYFVSQSGEQNLWDTLIWNEVIPFWGLGVKPATSFCYGDGLWVWVNTDKNTQSSADFGMVYTKLSGHTTDVCFSNGCFLECKDNDDEIQVYKDFNHYLTSISTPVNSLACIRGYGNTVIAGGAEGIVRSEYNGNYQPFTLVSEVPINKVFGYNGTWVACKTAGGLLVSSDDGETWTDVEGVTSDIIFLSIFANNGKWIASTEGQGVWESSDTETWAIVSSIPEKAVCSYVYSYENTWVICANGGTDETVTLKGAYVSYDNAVTWIAQDIGLSQFNGLSAVCSNGNTWMSISKNQGLISAKTYKADSYPVTFLEGDEVVYNGSVWERIPVGTVSTISGVSPVNGNVEVTGKNLGFDKSDIQNTLSIKKDMDYNIQCVYYANGIWVAGSHNGYTVRDRQGLWWSTDGKNWVKSNKTTDAFYTVYYANSVWVAGSYNQGLWWSTDGKTWTQVTGDTSSYDFRTVYYGNGIWVAGSYNQGLWWSTDGKTWTQGSGATNKSFYTVYCSDGIWVAGSTSGLWWSTDGKTWTQGSELGEYINSIYYSDGIWVAGSSSYGLWWSTDGKTWTQGSGATSYTFRTVYYTDGLWVTGSISHGLWWSTDGKTWTQGSGATNKSFYTVYCSDGIWVAGGDNYDGVWWSTDGKTWTQGSELGEYINSIYYSDGIWVAGSSSYGGIYWSLDGKVWSRSTTTEQVRILTVYYANGIWVAGSFSHGLWWSINGKTWTQVTGTTASYEFYSVYYANGIWVAGSESYGLWWSINGKTWTRGTGNNTSYTFLTVYCSDDIWVAGSESHGLWWSTDGKAWTQVTGDTSSYYFRTVYYGNGIWVAGSYTQGAWWSTDGKTWSPPVAGRFSANFVYFANGLWQACTSSLGIWWSEDGKTWTQVTGDTSSYDFRTVYYGNGIWVAGSYNQGLWWSTDGKTWTQGSGATNKSFYTVYCSDGIWVAGSSRHGLWWSTDGKTWKQVSGDTSAYTFNTVYYTDGLWVAGSEGQGIYSIILIINVTQAISYIKSKLGIQ